MYLIIFLDFSKPTEINTDQEFSGESSIETSTDFSGQTTEIPDEFSGMFATILFEQVSTTPSPIEITTGKKYMLKTYNFR